MMHKEVDRSHQNVTHNSPIILHEPALRRVAAYCRVSTDMEMQEGSFEMQTSYFRDMINAHPDMTLVEVYGDKGKTGRSIAARPAFRRMLTDCEAGRIDMIMTKSISRFARNLSECIDVLRRLKGLGIPVLFEKENINSMTEQGELMLSIYVEMCPPTMIQMHPPCTPDAP